MKYTLEFKLECIGKYKKGIQITIPRSVKHKRTFMSHVYAWTKAYDDLGIDGLKHSNENKSWIPEERFELVAKVLAGDSIKHVSKEAHINPGQLYQWVRKYNEKGMDGLQCKKGKKSKITIMNKKKTKKLTKSEKEELVLLRERNKLLEMENEYLKKLDALVSQREAAEAKAKRRK